MLKTACSSVIILISFLCLLKIENVRAQCSPNIGGNRQFTADSYKPSYPDGSTAEVECSSGYVPENFKASKSVTCKGSTWTDPDLQCKKRSCGSLPEVSNGRYTYSPEGNEGILFGATATPGCDIGYVLNGQPRHCTSKGWDGRDPVCEEVKCLPPPDPEHGAPTEPLEEVYSYQTVITYKCNEGYILSGPESISCLESGSFQVPPQCTKFLCGDLESVPNAVRTGASSFKLGSIVRFQCNQGYTLVGAGELICQVSGWSSSPPQCKATTTRQPTKAATPRPARPATEERVNPPVPTNPPPHNKGWKIALGIGIPLVLLALVGVYFFKKRSSARGYSGNVAKNEDGHL